mmetsp:Transcript_18214/g.32641  ORF Transcript_18214/g.32641 Transcript_18214/m.32641 type:complete len:650 (-) Transcript_18214:127-2076(-)
MSTQTPRSRKYYAKYTNMRTPPVKRKREISATTGKRLKLSKDISSRSASRVGPTVKLNPRSQIVTRSRSTKFRGRASRSATRGRSMQSSVSLLDSPEPIDKSPRALRHRSRQKKKSVDMPKRQAKSTPALKVGKLSFDDRQGTSIRWKLGQAQKTSQKGEAVVCYETAFNTQLNLDIAAGDLVQLANGSAGEIVFMYELNEEKIAEVRTVAISGRDARMTEGFLSIYISQVTEVLDPKHYRFIGVDSDVVDRLSTNRQKSRFYKSLLSSEDKESSAKYATRLLTLNSVPSSLVGREKEADRLQNFLRNGIKNKGSTSSMYMCGMPGTGKTATFLYAIHKLRQEYKDQFNFIHINCMKFAKPHDLYNYLATKIFDLDDKPNWAKTKALRNLTDYFKHPKPTNPIFIVLVDELDAIFNKRQDVLYNIFNWPATEKSHLIVVGIANTMDLTERFMSKISSRIGTDRIVFTPYTRELLQKMIWTRLSSTNIFTSDAINYACAKVANYSGDARRAFNVCCKAIEISRREGEQCVRLTHIMKAFEQLFRPATSRTIEILPKYLKLFIVACCSETKSANTEYIALHNLISRCNTTLVNRLNESMLKPAAYIELAQRLASLNLLTIEQRKLKLRVEVDEVCRALENDEIFALFADNF